MVHDLAACAVAADLLEAQADTLDAAFLALTPDGVLLSSSERFAAMWSVPKDVLARGLLSALAGWLLASGDDDAAALARLLTSPGPARRGEITLHDGRSISWRWESIRSDRGRAWSFQDTTAVSVGLLAAGLAHEINNPLAYTLLNLEHIHAGLRDLARRNPDEPLSDLLEAAETGLQGGRRVQAIIRDLGHFSR